MKKQEKEKEKKLGTNALSTKFSTVVVINFIFINRNNKFLEGCWIT